MRTQVLRGFKLINVLNVLVDGLSAMEYRGVADGIGECVGLRKEALAAFEVLQPKPLDVRRQVRKLAEPAMSVPVE